jgi:hypothetical protein
LQKNPNVWVSLALIANEGWDYLHPLLYRYPPVEYTSSAGIESPRSGESSRNDLQMLPGKGIEALYKDKTFFYAILQNIEIVYSRTAQYLL